MHPNAGATPAPREKRCPPGGWTREREQEQRRNAFALFLLPLLRRLHRAGIDTNAAVAEALNQRGIPAGTGKPWNLQAVAMLRYRLLVMGRKPPMVRLPPPPPRRSRRKG